MSSLSIRPYLPFCRVRVVRQSVSADEPTAVVHVEPDRRFAPVCHACGATASRVHSWDVRPLRDLNLGAHRVWVYCRRRKVYCPACRVVRVEDLDFFAPYARLTDRLARYVHDLCRQLSVAAVASHLGLDWKTVKDIDRAFLEEEYGATDYAGLRLLAVDEIAVKKGQTYMTVVLDYETGRVVWLGEGRSTATLAAFFAGMSPAQKKGLEAIAMDMWKPYLKAVRQAVPHVRIVFDLFHVVRAFARVIDRVRLSEFRRARGVGKELLKGCKYILLRNPEHLARDARRRLALLLQLNETISQVMLLKDMLKQLWRYHRRPWAERCLHHWCRLAAVVDHPAVRAFAKTLRRHASGILNHCDYPLHTSCLEGVNNTIKVIKRVAYGFHDDRYFALKVKQAFPGPPKPDPQLCPAAN